MSRPELGRFVRRLSLQWSNENEEKNHRIISYCPNVVIFFSSIPFIGERLVPWWRWGLPETIRCLYAKVHGIRLIEILALLENLPHLEILQLWGPRGESISHAPVCLPAVRILGIFSIDEIELFLPVLSVMKLPRLTALAFSVGSVDACRVFPLDVWRQLKYFQPYTHFYTGFRSDYFRNLRCLHLFFDRDGIVPRLGHFPFHQLECLTLGGRTLPMSDMDEWEHLVEAVVVVPLDAKAMPILKHFELELKVAGTYHFYRWDLRGPAARDRFIQYFESLVTRFEQRGVLVVESVTHGPNFCHAYRLVRDILAACRCGWS